MEAAAFLEPTDELLAIERRKWEEGCAAVAGVDEVGRGPLAGPVVAAAVVFPAWSCPPRVRDSKKLSPARREALRGEIVSFPGVDFAVAVVSPEVIDQINILRATHQAMAAAANNLKRIDFAIIDGLPPRGFPYPNQAVVKGDAKSASVAAASIVAKVIRDQLMLEYAAAYPGYGFERHMGYGTAEHLDALRRLGPSPIHRRTFAPVAALLDGGSLQYIQEPLI